MTEREDNSVKNKSRFYTYDNNGNIETREECEYTTGSHTAGTGSITTYTYENDKLTGYNGQSIVYDAVGNPTTYRGISLTWTRGRKLISYGSNTFEYDAQGQRTKKNGITYTYDSQGRILKQSNGLEFFYDTTGVAGISNIDHYI